MIHLVIAFLILIFMSLMVIEDSMGLRTAYFFACAILFAIYNIVHLEGLKLSLGALIKAKK